MRNEIKDIVCPTVHCAFGTPLGRSDIGADVDDCEVICDVAVPLDAQGYDPGGAYWGAGAELRCKFTMDRKYRRYCRKAVTK